MFTRWSNSNQSDRVNGTPLISLPDRWKNTLEVVGRSTRVHFSLLLVVSASQWTKSEIEVLKLAPMVPDLTIWPKGNINIVHTDEPRVRFYHWTWPMLRFMLLAKLQMPLDLKHPRDIWLSSITMACMCKEAASIYWIPGKVHPLCMFFENMITTGKLPHLRF